MSHTVPLIRRHPKQQLFLQGNPEKVCSLQVQILSLFILNFTINDDVCSNFQHNGLRRLYSCEAMIKLKKVSMLKCKVPTICLVGRPHVASDKPIAITVVFPLVRVPGNIWEGCGRGSIGY